MPSPATDDCTSISIRTIALADLEDFAAGCSADGGQAAPISPARLRSQLRNPCAAGEDIAMVAAFSGSRLVGYHGLMPGYFLLQGVVHKVSWATTFWVAEEMRGRGVGKLLVGAIQELGVDFAVTRMTAGAERAYRSMGLRPLGTLRYRQLRADKLSPASAEAKRSFYDRVGQEIAQPEGRLAWTEVPVISRWSQRYLQQTGTPRFHRPLGVVNWMLRYPWVFTRGEEVDSDGYYFSTTRELFTFKAFEICGEDGTSCAGFAVVSILSHKGRTVVKLLDYDFADKDDDHLALAAALTCAGEYAADRVEYAESLHRHLAPHLSDRLVKEQHRLCLFHPGAPDSPLARGAADIVLDYCDGDVVFA